MPTVTVAVLTCNRRALLEETLRGVLAQTWTDYELLVCDNASTDDTATLVASISDPRLVYVRRSVNGGAFANFREAVGRAKGDFVLVLHDDDVPDPRMLERQMAIFTTHPEVVLVGTNVRLIDYQGKVTQERIHPPGDRHFQVGDVLKAWLEEGFWFPCPTFMIRRSIRRGRRNNLLVFSRNSKNHALFEGLAGDIYSACILNAFGDAVCIGDPLLSYRQHHAQASLQDDPTRCEVERYKGFVHLCRTKKPLAHYLPRVEMALLHYRTQELILASQEPLGRQPRLTAQLRAMEARHMAHTPPLPDQAHFLQFLLLMKLLGEEPRMLLTPVSRAWLKAPTDQHMTAFRRWYARLALQGAPATRALSGRVYILGSLINAFLLALDCQRSGLQVLGFLDSNPFRAGRTLGGIPILPITEAPRAAREAEGLLISSEKRTEESMRSYLREFLPEEAVARCRSWRSIL